MQCYKCGSKKLVLAPLWPYERETYPMAKIVMRQCRNCGLEQNHYGDDELLEPRQGAAAAPAHD